MDGLNWFHLVNKRAKKKTKYRCDIKQCNEMTNENTKFLSTLHVICKEINWFCFYGSTKHKNENI